jgi:hypothetical protein
MAKVLRMTLTKLWFNAILSGEKKEEYRIIKKYWERRLCNYSGGFAQYDYVEFRNGYSNSSPKMVVRCNDISIGYGSNAHGAPVGEKCFIIKLGEIVATG